MKRVSILSAGLFAALAGLLGQQSAPVNIAPVNIVGPGLKNFVAPEGASKAEKARVQANAQKAIRQSLDGGIYWRPRRSKNPPSKRAKGWHDAPRKARNKARRRRMKRAG